MAERETIIERIRKLLALGAGKANAAEAASAVLMAQRLIAKYDIADDELHEQGKSSRVIAEAETVELKNARTWRVQLSNVVARSFRCKVYQMDRRRGGRLIYRYIFYGYEQDAQAAKLAYEYLYRTGDRLANAEVYRLRRGGLPTHGAYNSYITGFLMGITDELEKQSMELMVVVPKEVEDAYAELSADFKTFTRNLSCDHRRTGLIEQGRRDGQDAVRGHRLEDIRDFALEA